MTGTTSRQPLLFYLPLARQAALLKDDLLDPVDELLEDPALVDLVRQRLAARCPASTRTGHPSIAPDRLLRCCVVQHLKGWSFREKRRLLEISRAAQCLTEAGQQRMQESYGQLVAVTRGVVRQARAVLEARRLPVVGDRLRVETQIGQLRHFLPLVQKVIAQTRERVAFDNLIWPTFDTLIWPTLSN